MSDQHHKVAFLNRQQPTFSIAEAQRIADEYFGLQGKFKTLMSERDQNFRIETASGESYVFKISNANEDTGVVDMQCQTLAHLEAQDPALPVPRMVRTQNGALSDVYTTPDGVRHVVRVVHYLPGRVMGTVPNTPGMRRNVGAMLARLDIALRGFFHPSARHNHPWDITRCAGLRPQTIYIKNETTRRQVETIFGRMDRDVLPRLKKLRHQIVHQDAHTHNLLLNPEQTDEVVGLIDFGDMIYAPLICELAVTASSFISEDLTGDPIRVMGELAAGYDRILPLEADEIDLLYDLVLARHAITITITEMRKTLYPDDAPHIDLEEGLMEKLGENIERLLALGRARVSDGIRSACYFPPYFPAEKSDEDVIARRQRLLGQHATHFYKQPLHLERGQGVWLYGADGRRYLDCYNNIPQVGHCHPQVIQAITRQASALNTHTRYLYRAILDYTEKLTSLLPDHLTACILVNSGSEANDVAFQIAQFITGKRGAVIMRDAYHGITQSIMALSPDHPDTPLLPHVAGLLVPDPYTGPYRDGDPYGSGDDLAERYAADADRAIAELDEKGFGTAAFMVDTALCSSGIPNPPDGYFAGVERRVRAAGGLIICDEVQAGFGRLGAMWGHVLRGIKADIVTMGKPVGNGFPLGVVVTTPEILNAFVARTGLFSTFGGNPVACAAGRAVLDVIEAENLVANAKEVGEYFRAQLRQLMQSQPLIGDVRGEGLLIGVELVTDREARTPATVQMKPLLENLRQNGALVGSAGRNNNILKIRPPIIVQREHVDLFVAALDRGLGELG